MKTKQMKAKRKRKAQIVEHRLTGRRWYMRRHVHLVKDSDE